LVEWHPKGTLKLAEKRLLLYYSAQAMALHTNGVGTEPLGQWPLNAVDWEGLRSLLCQDRV